MDKPPRVGPGAPYYLLMAISWVLGFAFIVSAGGKGEGGPPIVTGLILAMAVLAAAGALYSLPPFMRRGRIIEVAISGGVITVASAILLPVFQSAAVSSSYSACMSNVKQLALGLTSYSYDYDDHLPPAAGWSNAILEYGSKSPETLHCKDSSAPYSYAFNSALSEIAFAKIKEPGSTVAIFECAAYAPSPSGGQEWFVKPHLGRGTIGFADGHSGRSKGDARWKP